ncbi:MAG: hypothetical protein E7588_00460 [Ruminococcaceae bacterium]|nr:hypothetical protein [Oscillospiraceae bacterium]
MPQLKAGFAKADITTDKGIVNDRLYAKVLVLDNGTNRVAFISMDCICLGGGIGDFSDEIFPNIKALSEKSGIDFVICGTTHTHTPYAMTLEEKEVISRIGNAVKEALGNMQRVRIGYSSGHENSFIINRTLTLKDGSASTIRQAHPCPRDEDIARVEFADDTVNVIKIECTDGTPICVMFTFGCHPLLGYSNNGVTANFPGIAERIVKEYTGAEAMMFQSCGGDVTEDEYKNYDIPKSCEKSGTALGLAVVRVLKEIETDNKNVSLASITADFPLRQDFDAVKKKIVCERDRLCGTLGGCPLNFKAFLPLYMKYLISPDYPLADAYVYIKEKKFGTNHFCEQDEINRKNIEKYLENLKTMEKLSKLATTLETLEWHEIHNKSYGASSLSVNITGVRIGDMLMVTAPVEPLTAIGENIKSFSPFDKTAVIGYANGYMHYGAPADIYNNGGYETIECMLAPEWQGVYENGVKKIIKELK